MKVKQCNFIIYNLVVAFLYYFYFHCLKLLFNVLLFRVRKYRRKQVSRFQFYDEQVRLHIIC